LQGTKPKDFPSGCISLKRNLVFDVERYAQALLLIDKMYAHWGKPNAIKQIAIRIAYGVGWDAAKLCTITGIGKARAERLIYNKIMTPKDLIRNKERVIEILGEGIAKKARADALEQYGEDI
jgi:replicative superfamily II helicase